MLFQTNKSQRCSGAGEGSSRFQWVTVLRRARPGRNGHADCPPQVRDDAPYVTGLSHRTCRERMVADSRADDEESIAMAASTPRPDLTRHLPRIGYIRGLQDSMWIAGRWNVISCGSGGLLQRADCRLRAP